MVRYPRVVVYIAIIISTLLPAMSRAALLADGTAQWSNSSGMTVTFTPLTDIPAGGTITLTLPETATVTDGFLFYMPPDTPVTVTGQSAVSFVRNATDNSVAISLRDPAPAGTSITVTMDVRVVSAYTASTYAQEAIAINITDTNAAPLDYGVALLTNDNSTQITATVPLLISMRVDDTTMDLGTLSVSSVKHAQQTYTINANNRTGVHVSIVADGPLRDNSGNTIDAVTDGTVSAGSEEYGFTLAAVDTAITPLFDTTQDHALPYSVTRLAETSQPVGNATFDLLYKAAISGDTVAGNYTQTVTVTIASNS